MDRAAELAAIAAFLETRSVTCCPPGYAGAVDGALPRAEERARLERLQLQRALSHRQIKDLLFVALKARSQPSR